MFRLTLLRSYGSEVTEQPYEQARRLPRHFRTTPLEASLPRQFSSWTGWASELLWSVSLSMIFHYHLFSGEVRTIRNETTYPIHGQYPLSQIIPYKTYKTSLKTWGFPLCLRHHPRNGKRLCPLMLAQRTFSVLVIITKAGFVGCVRWGQRTSRAALPIPSSLTPF